MLLFAELKQLFSSGGIITKSAFGLLDSHKSAPEFLACLGKMKWLKEGLRQFDRKVYKSKSAIKHKSDREWFEISTLSTTDLASSYITAVFFCFKGLEKGRVNLKKVDLDVL